MGKSHLTMPPEQVNKVLLLLTLTKKKKKKKIWNPTQNKEKKQINSDIADTEIIKNV